MQGYIRCHRRCQSALNSYLMINSKQVRNQITIDCAITNMGH